MNNIEEIATTDGVDGIIVDSLIFQDLWVYLENTKKQMFKKRFKSGGIVRKAW